MRVEHRLAIDLEHAVAVQQAGLRGRASGPDLAHHRLAERRAEPDLAHPEEDQQLADAIAHQQRVILPFYLDEAKKEDAASVEVFRNANVEIADMTEEDFNEWLALAKETSFKAFVEELPDGQALLDMALSVE